MRSAALPPFAFLKQLFLAFVGSVAFACIASAHHSGAAYDRTRLVTIEGTVTARGTWDHRPDLAPVNEPCDPEIALRFLEEAQAR